MSKFNQTQPLRSVNNSALVAIGSNVDPSGAGLTALFDATLAALAEGPGEVTAVSRFYRSPAFPAGSGPDYLNGALALCTPETPQALLARLHAIEERFGRERKTRWGARVLDLDLLAVGEAVCPDAATQDAWRALPLARQMQEAPGELILPHPRLQDRAFVLVPLADVAPDWAHPRLGRSVAEMCGDLPRADRDALVPVT